MVRGGDKKGRPEYVSWSNVPPLGNEAALRCQYSVGVSAEGQQSCW